MGVAPWELVEQSTFWRDAALYVENHENWVESELRKRAASKRRRGG